MKLISWNVNGRKGAVRGQAQALASREPDIVALQEVRSGSVDAWKEELAGAGLTSIVSTQDRLSERRRNFLLAASRFQLDELPEQIQVPLPELVLSLDVHADGEAFELIVAHVPNAQGHKGKKVEHLEALYGHLATGAATTPRVLCGDFNCPRREFPDGTVYTWARRESGEMRPSRGQRWDDAEMNIIRGLEAFDMVDVHRECNGFTGEGSWFPRGNTETPRRFDHVFASRALNPTRSEFIHEWRTGAPRLSDHSAIEVAFAG